MTDIDNIRHLIKIEYTHLLNEDPDIANTDPINDILTFLNKVYTAKGRKENIKDYGKDFVLSSKDRVEDRYQQEMLTPTKYNNSFSINNPSNLSFYKIPPSQFNFPTSTNNFNQFNASSSSVTIPNAFPVPGSGFFPTSQINHGNFPTVNSNNLYPEFHGNDKEEIENWGIPDDIQDSDLELFNDSKFRGSFSLPTIPEGEKLVPNLGSFKTPPRNLQDFNWNNNELNDINNYSFNLDADQYPNTIDSNQVYENLNSDDESTQESYDYNSDEN